MYATDDANRFLEVTYQNGDKEILYFKDFSSGAMIENIVRRAKKLSIKRQIEGGEQGHLHPGPARLDPPGVPRARGPAEHDQPRRLGEDLGQEGRAHRVRAHAAVRGRRGHGRSPDRACHHRSVPVSRYACSRHRARRARTWPRADSPSRLTRGHPEGVRDRDRVRRRRCAARPTPTRCWRRRCSSTATSSTTRSAGTSRTSRPAATPAGFAREGAHAAGDRDPPRQHRAHQRRALLRRPRAPRVLHAECADALELVCADKAGERILARSMLAARRLLEPGPGDRRLQEQLRRQGQLATAPTRTTSSTGRCRSRTLVRNLLPWFVSRQVFTGAGKVGSENGAARRRLPDQPARRLLRGGGRARDHAEAPDRQHARRAARRPAAVPPPARDRRRRQPVRGRDVPEGRHHRDRARDDRRRLHRQGPLDHRPGRRDAHRVARPDVPRDGRAARRRRASPRSSCSGSSCAWRRSTPTRPASSAAAATTSAAMVLTRWESVLADLERDPMRARRPARLGHEAVAARGLRATATASSGTTRSSSLLDLQYHDVRPDRSLYERLVRAGKVERLVDEDDVHRGDDGAAGDAPGRTSGASAWPAGPTRWSRPTGTASSST